MKDIIFQKREDYWKQRNGEFSIEIEGGCIQPLIEW